MSLFVMKFGGTSVGSAERIQRAADRIIQRVKAGDKVITVVSAMGKKTDELLDLAMSMTDRPSKRELDMLLSTGEQQTIALLAMALISRGYPAVSLTGWQAGIRTENVYGNARIKDIDITEVQGHLEAGEIVIVAGFQGVTEDGEITTLGRGGSDTSAVALAAANRAELCEIYTDVDGVYTTDPRYVKAARKLDDISFDEMLEMANLGAGVLHPRAVENAKQHHVPLVVRSSFDDSEGTIIKEESTLEKGLSVRGIAFEKDVVKVTLLGLPNKTKTLSKVFKALAEDGINVDVIIQNALDEEETSISFTVSSDCIGEALDVLHGHKETLMYRELDIESDLAKISIIGSGMASNPGVAAEMFEALNNHGIKVRMVSTSEIKVSTIIESDQLQSALDTLHEAFHLDETVKVN